MALKHWHAWPMVQRSNVYPPVLTLCWCTRMTGKNTLIGTCKGKTSSANPSLLAMSGYNVHVIDAAQGSASLAANTNTATVVLREEYFHGSYIRTPPHVGRL